MSLDVEIPAPGAAKKSVNHGYVGDANSSGDEEHPYDDAPLADDAVRNSYSTHTYEATSDMDSDSETDSDGYIYPDAQNLPHTAANVAAASGRTEAPCGPAPPTPRHRDVPAPPPLPRRSTSIQSQSAVHSPQPPLPQRSTSLQSELPNLEPITPNPKANIDTDKRSTMGHEYSDPKDLNSDSSDPDSDLYDDTYHEAISDSPTKKESSPEYHVYDASCSESKESGTPRVTGDESKLPLIAVKETSELDLSEEAKPSQLDDSQTEVTKTSGERPESWASSGSDHLLNVGSTLKPSRWSGSSFMSGTSSILSLSDHSDVDFEEPDESQLPPPRVGTLLRKHESLVRKLHMNSMQTCNSVT